MGLFQKRIRLKWEGKKGAFNSNPGMGNLSQTVNVTLKKWEKKFTTILEKGKGKKKAGKNLKKRKGPGVAMKTTRYDKLKGKRQKAERDTKQKKLGFIWGKETGTLFLNAAR